MALDAMGLAHLTLATRDVARTAAFFEATLGYRRVPPPQNSPVVTAWLDVGRGQQMHLVEDGEFRVSTFEGEFGRHVAVHHAGAELAALKDRLVGLGAEIIEPLRPTAVERFFFRDPVNGYVFEVIGQR